jgi:hypothetical protein
MTRSPFPFLAAGLLLSSLPAQATEIDFSGFGTLGYARTDQPYVYQRYMDEDGTIARDSVLGLQMDARFNASWGATVQAKFAPAEDDDDRWKPTLSWAFVSWRPDNDWWLRIGKLRVPAYLNSENLDVGATFDFARLPYEMYSMTPTADFTGASFSKNWSLASGDLTLDGYWGKAKVDWRHHLREGVPGILPAGPSFNPVNVEAQGLALTYNGDSDTYRVGLHQAIANNSDGSDSPINPVLVTLAPGISYYDFQPGPGVPSRDEVEWNILSVGADIDLGHDARLAAEFAVRRANVSTGLKTRGGYVSLRKRIGAWTPYLYYARLSSDDDMLDLYQSLNNSSVPAFVPNASVINASQQVFADFLQAYDQHTWAIGTSYTVSATSKIKAEWARTEIGIATSLVDSPAGPPVSNQSINVLSLSYSFVF